jgi:hypothetical protein
MMDIQDVKRELEQRWPGLEFKAGYIGNVERWGDDRSWYLWCDSFKLSVSVGETANLPTTSEGWAPFIDRVAQHVLIKHWTNLIYFVGLRRSDGTAPGLEKAVEGSISLNYEDAKQHLDAMEAANEFSVFSAVVVIPRLEPCKEEEALDPPWRIKCEVTKAPTLRAE